ncbi:unnamed protein product [Ambrosiozyma monospora]|uniref:Unnamed protein product n=1 Tax=Ambrosiozyma monospora TaxID=43982 RepID=A0A9W6YSB7_AMBMO|nr:unnamed protein product [Ambrosiozyma monospora]
MGPNVSPLAKLSSTSSTDLQYVKSLPSLSQYFTPGGSSTSLSAMIDEASKTITYDNQNQLNSVSYSNGNSHSNSYVNISNSTSNTSIGSSGSCNNSPTSTFHPKPLSGLQRLTPLHAQSSGSIPTMNSLPFKIHPSMSSNSLARSYSNTDLATYSSSDLIAPHFKKSRPNSPGLVQPPTTISRSPNSSTYLPSLLNNNSSNLSNSSNRDSSAALHLLGFSTQQLASQRHQTPDATPLQTPSVSPKIGGFGQLNSSSDNNNTGMASNPNSQQQQQRPGLHTSGSTSQLPPLSSLKLGALPDKFDINGINAGTPNVTGINTRNSSFTNLALLQQQQQQQQQGR